MAARASLREADISISASGDNTVVAAVSGSPIKVYKLWMVATGAVNFIIKDGTTALNATAVPLTANGSSMTFAYDEQPYWTTSAGNAFTINLSGAVGVTGRIYYTLG